MNPQPNPQSLSNPQPEKKPSTYSRLAAPKKPPTLPIEKNEHGIAGGKSKVNTDTVMFIMGVGLFLDEVLIQQTRPGKVKKD